MPRKRERKSIKGLHSDVAMREALKLTSVGMKVRTAAKQFGLSHETLRRYITKYGKENIPQAELLTSKYNHRQVFSAKEEKEIEDYVLLRCVIGYGMTQMQIRQAAFECASKNGIEYPQTWNAHQRAGLEWYLGFMKRHPGLSTRAAEQCSIARAAAFNKVNIENYFSKLEGVLARNPDFQSGLRLFNLDETKSTTAPADKDKIIAPKGQKQVHKIKGHERGTTITTCCCVGAQGIAIPPVMIFPRAKFTKSLLVDAYPNTLGLATKSGWMTQDMFIPTLKHVVKHTNCSINNPILLIVDNVGSHLSMEALQLCKDNGITLFTLPPHTTHHTQPLDVGVFGPYQRAYERAVNEWQLSNPGIPPSIYNVAKFVNVAWSKSATPANIIASFKATGICPLNKEIFQEKDFMPSLVTHQPDPNSVQGEPDEENNEAQPETENNEEVLDDPIEASDSSDPTTATPENTKKHLSPVEILGIPKAKPRTASRAPRRKGHCMVATDTSEMMQIEERSLNKKKKEEEKDRRKAAREEKRLQKLFEQKFGQKKTKRGTNKKKQGNSKRKLIFQDQDSNEESCDEFNNEEPSEQVNPPITEDNFPPLKETPVEDDHVLVEFCVKGKIIYYIGRIIKNIDSNFDLEISYLRKSAKQADKFLLPNVPDLNRVGLKDIKMILPKPTCQGTKRQQNILSFATDLSHLTMG